MGKHKGRSGRTYRTKRAVFRGICQRENRPCALCGGPIDYTLTGKHPLAWSLDHIIPVSRLPENDRRLESYSNFQAAHFSCNTRKGNGTYRGNGVRPGDTEKPPVAGPVASREWV